MKTLLEQHCSPEWLSFIKFHESILSFDKSTYIFEVGDKTKGLFFIVKGKVKILYKQHDGNDRLIRLAREGDVLGHRGFGGNWTYPISAYTLEPVELSFVPVEVFNVIAKTNPNFAYHMMMFFAEELRKSEAKLKYYPVINHIARALLDNYRAFGFENENSTKLNFTLTRKDLSSMAGTSYETVVRTLAEFNKLGIIKIDGKAIHILNLEQLVSLARPERH